LPLAGGGKTYAAALAGAALVGWSGCCRGNHGRSKGGRKGAQLLGCEAALELGELPVVTDGIEQLDGL